MDLERHLRGFAEAGGLPHNAQPLPTAVEQAWSFDNLGPTIIANARRPPLKAEPVTPRNIKKSQTPTAFDGDAASITLPIGLPAHLKQLLRDYFEANKTDQVPNEIYCIQSHRVFGTVARYSTGGKGKQAIYVSPKSGGRLDIETFTLRSCAKRHGKISECLLVASGQDLPEQVILARQKPYSNDFRAWAGVADIGGPVIATRCLLDHESNEEAALVSKRSARDLSNFLKRQGITPLATSTVPDREPTLGAAMGSERRAKRLKVAATSDTGLNGQGFTNKGSPNIVPLPAIAPPDGVIPHYREPAFVSARPYDIKIRFLNDQDEEVRPPRSLADCNTIEKIFGNATVGGLLSIRDFAVVKASVDGKELALVDDHDFQDLRNIVDSSASVDGGAAVIEIRKYT